MCDFQYKYEYQLISNIIYSKNYAYTYIFAIVYHGNLQLT